MRTLCVLAVLSLVVAPRVPAQEATPTPPAPTWTPGPPPTKTPDPDAPTPTSAPSVLATPHIQATAPLDPTFTSPLAETAHEGPPAARPWWPIAGALLGLAAIATTLILMARRQSAGRGHEGPKSG